MHVIKQMNSRMLIRYLNKFCILCNTKFPYIPSLLYILNTLQSVAGMNTKIFALGYSITTAFFKEQSTIILCMYFYVTKKVQTCKKKSSSGRPLKYSFWCLHAAAKLSASTMTTISLMHFNAIFVLLQLSLSWRSKQK